MTKPLTLPAGTTTVQTIPLNVGAYMDQMASELGASKGSLKPARLEDFSRTVRSFGDQVPGLRSAANLAASALDHAKRVAVGAKMERRIDALDRPTHIVSVNVDALATVTETSEITIAAPYSGQPWKICAFFVNDAQIAVAIPIRMTEFMLVGQDRVPSAIGTVSGISPTKAGIDLALFSHKNQLAAVNARYQLWPWGLGSGWLKSDAVLKMKFYNPAGSSQSLNFSILVQASPCGTQGETRKHVQARSGFDIMKAINRVRLDLAGFLGDGAPDWATADAGDA